jgi:hypothetical protein
LEQNHEVGTDQDRDVPSKRQFAIMGFNYAWARFAANEAQSGTAAVGPQ